MDKTSWDRRRSAVGTAVRDWLGDPNVMLVDFGWRKRGNERVEDEPCIRIHVLKKLREGPVLEMATQRGFTRGLIPKEIDGFPVDVPEHVYRLHQQRWGGGWFPPVNLTARKSRVSPMQGGISVSDYKRNIAGTLGGLVVDRETGEQMLLSNFHVLAGVWDAQPGWAIYQPGRGDGGSGEHTVATLARHAMEVNFDAAVAKLTGDRELLNTQYELTPPVNGVAWAQLGMEVVKSGRTSGVTRGRVIGVEGSLKLTYDNVSRIIRNVMEIEPRQGSVASEPGDSGSFWLDEKTMSAIGLHFAGSDYPERALAMDMQPVLDALKVDLP